MYIWLFSIKNICEGGGCTKSKITHVSGCLPTGKQAEMESRLNFHSDRTLKTKVQGGCNEIEILGAHVMDYHRPPFG